MKRSHTLINIVSSLLLQLVTIVSGFVIPRIILHYFGSEVNGLVASLNQFLNYISLLEGGVSAVILSALYKPLAENDDRKTSAVLCAAQQFFRKIALLYVFFALGIGAIYPLVVSQSFSWGYIFSLTCIMALNLLIQYVFSLTYRLLLTADRKMYIVSLSQIIFIVINLSFTIIAALLFPTIHLIKGISAAAFLIQPVIYSAYVKKHYHLDLKCPPDSQAISQRWAGFGQNLAFFIHTNTDVVVLTFFASLSDVSVYYVYFMVVSALKNLVISISSALAPSMGNVLTKNDLQETLRVFDDYEFGINLMTTFLFTCGAVLLTPFVQLYTKNITDAQYYRPLFGVLLTLAEAVYCFRDPFVSTTYAKGHFKQTEKYAYIEAGANIVLSVLLVRRFGLIGVAVGTLVSMLYRAVMHVLYLQKNILYRSPLLWIRNLLPFLGAGLVSAALCTRVLVISSSTIPGWILYALVVSAVSAVCLLVSLLLFRRNALLRLLSRFIKRKSS